MNIDTFMRHAGETFQVERGEERFTVEGLKHQRERRVDFKPGTDIRVGDWLRGDFGHRYYVRETDVQMFQQKPFALEAFYLTESEYAAAQSAPQSPAPVFNIFGDSYSSIIGTQQHAEVLQPTFTFGDLDMEIERRGGEDAEALKEMMREIRTSLETQDNISRGKLLRFSELLNRHAWITGPISQLLLVFATTGQIS